MTRSEQHRSMRVTNLRRRAARASAAMAAAMAMAVWSMPLRAGPTVTAEAPALTPAARVASAAELSQQAWKLATDSGAGAVFSQVRQLPADGDPAVTQLRSELASYEKLEADRAAKTKASYEKKAAEMAANLTAGKTRKALGNAVEASGLADDADVFLAELKVRELTSQAEKEAADHEAKGEWTKAMALYRGLDLLYEHQNRYTDSLKRIGRRVMLLRLYAPDVLFDLYKQEAKELGEDEPQPFTSDDDHWQTQLDGIQMRMLHESLHMGASQHVESSGFDNLLVGGIDALSVMLDTKGMEKAFASLGEPEKVKPMLEFLAEAKKQIQLRPDPLGYLEAARWLSQIQQKNEQTVKLPEAVIIHELGDGAMTTLDDFSNIIWPHDRARFDRTISGKFSGVGIQISLVNRQLTVVTPLSDTPAHRAGIKPGDRIVTIDGKGTLGMELDTAVDMITGEEGTQVTLGIKGAADDAQTRDVPLVRSTIKIDSIKGWQRQAGGSWDYIIDPQDKIAYMRMTSFGPTTAAELDAAVAAAKKAGGINGLILDLRFNPGGLLKAAEEVSNRFLNSGVIVSTTAMVDGQPWSARADASHTYDNFPVVVLINKGSASASEIVAGALQDHHRALIVGERSFGKGSVQNLFRIGNGAGFLKLTTQYYKIPSGRIIHHRPGAGDWGITPDVTVRMTDRQVADSIEARTLLDILVDDGGKEVDPTQVLNSRAKPDAPKEGEEPAEPKPEVHTAADILTLGLDPQLETALLLLKTRLLTLAAK